ncbi:MAG: ATP-binding protein [bacterium]|nr:ATP-binding protein [bacterium]
MVIKRQENDKISVLLNDLNSLQSYVNDIFTFSPLSICFISPIGVILESNPAFMKISGLSFNEVIGKSIEYFFNKREIKQVASDTMEKGFVEGKEVWFSPKEKAEIPIQVFTRARIDEKGEKLGYFLSIVDLTEIKKTQRDARRALMSILEDVKEEKNKAEEEKNKTLAIITNFADGILVLDKNNRISLVNPKAESFFKIKTKNAVGKIISEILKEGQFLSLMEIFNKKGEEFSREEIKIKEELILEISLVPVVREEKKIGSLIILHDVTREKLVEKMKSEFVSLTAHQLRTPLSAMKWAMRMILDEELGKINREQRDFLQNNYNSNEKMIHLINDLLNVTRIEEGRFLYQLVPADIEQITKEAVKFNKESAKKRKIKLEFEKPVQKIPKFMMDADKIKMALENLIDNGLRYNRKGGCVKVFLEKVEDKVKISIEDNGLGIPENQYPRIFTKFFRGANVIKTDTEGSGLGLYIAKNIIEAHRGKIWFESEINKGTTFYFQIPIKK